MDVWQGYPGFKDLMPCTEEISIELVQLVEIRKAAKHMQFMQLELKQRTCV